VAQLHYRHAAMNSGKSTMVLQYRHTYAACGRNGLLMTRLDRAGTGVVSSRIGLVADALEIGATTDLTELVLSRPGPRVDHVIVDEAQFLAPEQVDQLAALVDDHDIDVFTFGCSRTSAACSSRARPGWSCSPTSSRRCRCTRCAGAGSRPG